MKRSAIALLLCAPFAAYGATESAVGFEPANVDLTNRVSLQRGAGLFVNGCMGCHSVKYMRWGRVATDLGIPEELLSEYLQTTGDAPVDTMRVAMRADDASEWFGIAPPDLSLTARSRGADWVYNFLLNFYVDESRPNGVNNLVFKDTAMPHVLWDMQGLQRANFDENGHFTGYEMVREGTMDAAEYRRAVRDITAFMSYLSEPAQAERRSLGLFVLAFLLGFLGLAYLTKREYWKDVH